MLSNLSLNPVSAICLFNRVYIQVRSRELRLVVSYLKQGTQDGLS